MEGLVARERSQPDQNRCAKPPEYRFYLHQCKSVLQTPTQYSTRPNLGMFSVGIGASLGWERIIVLLRNTDCTRTLSHHSSMGICIVYPILFFFQKYGSEIYETIGAGKHVNEPK